MKCAWSYQPCSAARSASEPVVAGVQRGHDVVHAVAGEDPLRADAEVAGEQPLQPPGREVVALGHLRDPHQAAVGEHLGDQAEHELVLGVRRADQRAQRRLDAGPVGVGRGARVVERVERGDDVGRQHVARRDGALGEPARVEAGERRQPAGAEPHAPHPAAPRRLDVEASGHRPGDEHRGVRRSRPAHAALDGEVARWGAAAPGSGTRPRRAGPSAAPSGSRPRARGPPPAASRCRSTWRANSSGRRIPAVVAVAPTSPPGAVAFVLSPTGRS